MALFDGKKRFFYVFAYLLIIITFILVSYLIETEKKHDFSVIRRAIDGDTIELENDLRVRLLGINTPEKKRPLHDEALDFLRQFEGKEARLEWTNEEKDKYGRLLRYVFVDGKMLNELVLRRGLGNLYIYGADKYTKLLSEAEQEARNSKSGIWVLSLDKCADCLSVNIENGMGKNDCKAGIEFVTLSDKCDFECDISEWNIKDEANHFFVFDNSVIDSGGSVVVYSGVGKDNKTSFYFNNKGCASVWNDEHDTLFLRDKKGGLVLYYKY